MSSFSRTSNSSSSSSSDSSSSSSSSSSDSASTQRILPESKKLSTRRGSYQTDSAQSQDDSSSSDSSESSKSIKQGIESAVGAAFGNVAPVADIIAPTESLSPEHKEKQHPEGSAVKHHRTSTKFTQALQAKKEGTGLTWRNVNYLMPLGRRTKANPNDPTIRLDGKKKTKWILNNVSGYVQPGQFLAILGPSGSGKTSLLNLLSGRTSKGKIEGDIKMNGNEWSKRLIGRTSGYVMQEDIMFPHLTIRESLMFIAQLRLPSSTTYKQKTEIVNNLIEELGLRKSADTIIGDEKVRGISGGERKRVNIAMEMITSPNILFLDEPTSGLDAFTSLTIVETLTSLAEANYSVVTTIHQPRYNIFEYFHNIMILSFGEVIYFGPAKAAVTYFAGLNFTCPTYYNPPDYFLDIVTADTRSPEAGAESKERIRSLASAYKEGPMPLQVEKAIDEVNQEKHDVHKTPNPNAFHTFAVLTQRAARNYWRQKPLTVARFMVSLVFGVIIGLTYLQLDDNQVSIQDRNGILFFVLINTLFNALFAVWNAFPSERVVFWKERRSGLYSTMPYYLAKQLVELPCTLIATFIFATIVYWMAGLHTNGWRYLIFLGVVELVAIISESFGLLYTAAFPNQELSSAVSAISLVLFVVFGGFYLNVNNTPKYFIWIEYLSFCRYSFEALVVNEYTDLRLRCSRNEFITYANGSTLCQYTRGEQVIRELAFKNGLETIARDVGIIIGMIIFIRILTYFALKWVKASKEAA